MRARGPDNGRDTSSPRRNNPDAFGRQIGALATERTQMMTFREIVPAVVVAAIAFGEVAAFALYALGYGPRP